MFPKGDYFNNKFNIFNENFPRRKKLFDTQTFSKGAIAFPLLPARILLLLFNVPKKGCFILDENFPKKENFSTD